jgi:hypothetical protein
MDKPGETGVLRAFAEAVTLLRAARVDIVLWKVQNAYFRMAATTYPGFAARTSAGDGAAQEWVGTFRDLGEQLFFNTGAVLRKAEGEKT